MTNLNAPPLLHDRYRITGKLGDSRLAIVYRAQDERLKRSVLVHLLRPELIATLRERFTEEAQRGAQRSHPGLLEVFDTGQIGERPYMITEDVAGAPLADAIPLPTAQALAVLRTITGAVALAQSQSAPHPPISSRNVWLLEDGRAILLENWHLSPRDAALDFAHYRAPERAKGGPPSPATTVYALGVLAWETLVGRRPYSGPTPEAIATQQLAGEILSVSSVLPRLYAPELDRIIEQAAASSPNLRYPTPTDFGRALDLLVDNATAQTGRLAILQPQAFGLPRTGRETQTLTAGRPVRAVANMAPTPPPPPPAVIRTPPRPTPRAMPAQPLAVPVDQKTIGKEVQKAVRKELRRNSCQQSILRFVWRATVIVLIVGGLYLAGGYALNAITGYVTNQAERFDPRAWLERQLPDVGSWFEQQVRENTPDVPIITTYEVIGPLNLRSSPGLNGEVIVQLAPGMQLRALGEQRTIDGQEWIRVVTVNVPPQTGWVANLAASLSKQ